MSYGDFLRQMPAGTADLRQRHPLALRLHIDFPLLGLLLLLTAIGLSVLYSASGAHLPSMIRQGQYFLVAYVVMFIVAQFDMERIKRLAPYGYVAGVVLLLLVELVGVHAKGAQRWLSFGGFRFQPSEIMKIVMPATAAWYLSARVLPPRFKYVLATLALIALPTGLIMHQPDLGTSILIVAAGAFVLFLSGLSWRYIVGAVVALIAAIYPMWQFVMHDYQRQRVLTLLDPESDKLGAGWNIIQSKTAIGSGGFDGKGWLHGTQSQLDFLPEGHTDFIIAVLAEEWGLRGVLALLFIYLLVLARGAWIAINARHCFGRLLAGSVVLTFFVYIFINMGMVAGLLPVVGVPLPLISRGGTALVTLFVGFGLLMSISTERRILMQ